MTSRPKAESEPIPHSGQRWTTAAKLTLGPTENRWLHSDFRNAARPFVSPAFKFFVTQTN